MCVASHNKGLIVFSFFWLITIADNELYPLLQGNEAAITDELAPIVRVLE
jgi:hypothetical protein